MSKDNTETFHLRFLRLATVNILSNIAIPLAGLVDTAFLGHLADINYLAGVALATVIFNLVYRNCNFLRMGTTGPTAQAEGRFDQDGVTLVLLRNGLIALTLGLLIILLQYPLREIGFTLLSAAPEVKAAGQDYFNARIWGAPATLLNLVLIGWFLGREKSSKVLVLSAIGNGANIILDYLLIIRWGWASAGAGFATAAGQYLMLLMGMIFIATENGYPQMLALVDRIFDLEAIKSTFKLNGNIWIRSIASTITIAAFTDLSAYLGTMVLAINTLLLQVMIVTFYFIEGLSFATESIAGNFRGQGLTNKFPSLLRLSGASSLGIGLTIASLFVLLPDPLFGLMTNHGEVIDELHHYLLWLLPFLGLSSMAFMLDGYFLGLTEGALLRKGVVTGSLVGFLPVAVASWWFHSSQILWLAMCCYMGVRALALAVQVPKTMRSENI
ncbi:MAG: MATE family efflux transporter [Moorea sp. SIO1G6]|uniref:guanitoxin biosynthesis MATE family efflux transporter GntT n=1 Tax=Moorena sp. SIO1G6 TaxID=2607840 RepID=UPI0013BFFEF8|nr:guanitoxin biosynthesis MATE family efflux transporter GntT [Moorena sp. SIO1G6]NET67054.1 MATE family efflux transporter [Moorena sp. SIO1G6]